MSCILRYIIVFLYCDVLSFQAFHDFLRTSVRGSLPVFKNLIIEVEIFFSPTITIIGYQFIFPLFKKATVAVSKISDDKIKLICIAAYYKWIKFK